MTLQQVFVISWYFKFAFLLWFFLFVIYEIREFSFEANKTVIELNRKKYYCGYLFKLTLIDHFDYYLCLCKRVKSSCIVLKKGWEGWWWGAQANERYSTKAMFWTCPIGLRPPAAQDTLEKIASFGCFGDTSVSPLKRLRRWLCRERSGLIWARLLLWSELELVAKDGWVGSLNIFA